MIFLHSGIFVDFFAIFTCHALVGYRTQLNSFLSNVAFNGLANGTDLNSVCAVNCEIYVKNIQIYIHTYIHTYMTQARFPSLVGLRLRAFGAKPPSEQITRARHMLSESASVAAVTPRVVFTYHDSSQNTRLTP